MIHIMKQKNYIIEKINAMGKKIIFCSECGEELELFGIEEVDVQKIKERHKHCREVGRFKGDKCAMLFIAESNEELFTDDEFSNKDL
jgi:hypothetical protein